MIDQLADLDAWLRSILWDSKLPATSSDTTGGTETAHFEIHRLKARLELSGGDIKIIQGVREIFEIIDAPKADKSAAHSSSPGKVVLIGRNLQNVPLEKSFFEAMSGS